MYYIWWIATFGNPDNGEMGSPFRDVKFFDHGLDVRVGPVKYSPSLCVEIVFLPGE